MFTQFILGEPRGLARVLVGLFGGCKELGLALVPGVHSRDTQELEPGLESRQEAGAVGKGPGSSPPHCRGSCAAHLPSLLFSSCPKLALLTSALYLFFTSMFPLPCHLACVSCSLFMKSFHLPLL